MNSRGIALITGLALLAAVSLLAILTASGTLLQRNMATNFQQNSLALESASIASVYAQAWLFSRPANAREPDCLNQCILPIAVRNGGELPPHPEYEGSGWWQSHGYITGFDPEAAEVPDSSRHTDDSAYWLIEEIHYEPASVELSTDELKSSPAAGIGYYRIFGRGEGRSPNSVAVVESIVARPWGGEFDRGDFPPTGPQTDFCRQFIADADCGVLAWRQRR